MNVNGNQHISINIDKQSDKKKKPRGVEKIRLFANISKRPKSKSIYN